jgi:hypothetical protein
MVVALYFLSRSKRFVIAVVGFVALTAWMAQPGLAQLRNQLKNQIVDMVASKMVTQIQTDSCPEFAAMLKNAKSSSGSDSSKAGGIMKNDPAARQRFINKVAGPLLNKMIDCDLLPGR